ncbi:hypothetical protein ERO13_D09G108500v2 [Gossypium hirsutum]|uniref:F-box protein At1g67623 n=1 Tax=Gossypium hirsutum TaxID=3635 RepID=A0A1U8I4F4_GOSHI|nr:putative F-box protein At1g67623 [Gossypium hirsutum]KAG4129898.1 hypothetical protein ERO13_D09G108500v2 [Gossypium hirsutum]
MTTNFTSDIVTSLPEHMLSEILKHAASNSIADFINVKLCCKAFDRASNYENVSMEKVSLVPWHKCEKGFQKRCKAANNAEALYRKGMINCFSRRKSESGLRCLKKATEKGHVEAVYTYGIILICLDGELRKQGLRVLSSLHLPKPNQGNSRMIASCRSKTEKFLSCMWVHVALTGPKGICCNCDCDIEEKPNHSTPSECQAWDASNDVSHCCDYCFWDREANLFCSLLRKYLIN